MSDAEGNEGGGEPASLSPEASASALDARELYESGVLSPDDDFLGDWTPDDADADDGPKGTVTVVGSTGGEAKSSLSPMALAGMVLAPMWVVLTAAAYVFVGQTSALVLGGLFGAMLLTVVAMRVRKRLAKRRTDPAE